MCLKPRYTIYLNLCYVFMSKKSQYSRNDILCLQFSFTVFNSKLFSCVYPIDTASTVYIPLSQCGQLYGFCPECVIKCLKRISFCAKLFWHTSHWKGRSPVWILSCLINAERVGNHFSQIPQLKPGNNFDIKWLEYLFPL